MENSKIVSQKPGFLVLFHCESNPGYAASSHELTFFDVAKHFVEDLSDIHFAYSSLEKGNSPNFPKDIKNVIELNTNWQSKDELLRIEQYVKENNITHLLGFDQPVSRPAYRAIRRGGVRYFVSYWGAPMSSLNRGLKLQLKKLEVALSKLGPDHYIFQSNGMRDSATLGRGIPMSKTSIVRTGIDTEQYRPDSEKSFYAHEQFNIPTDRRIIVFTGHMERRKGVHIILQAAHNVIHKHDLKDVHFLILGNRIGEEENFSSYLADPLTRSHITFGGYRNDIKDLLKSCSIGMIASTEWDSFPMSSLEMAATEIPLIVSNLEGLNETVTKKTGVTFNVGDWQDASMKLITMLSSEKNLTLMGKEGRKRVVRNFSRSAQANGIINAFDQLSGVS